MGFLIITVFKKLLFNLEITIFYYYQRSRCAFRDNQIPLLLTIGLSLWNLKTKSSLMHHKLLCMRR